MNDQLDLIQIQIPPKLEQMWDRLGLAKDERESEISSLYKLLQNQYNIYIQTVQNRVQDAEKEVSDISSKLTDLMKACGQNKEDIDQNSSVPSDIPLKQQLRFLKANYETAQSNSKDRISKMESMINVLNQYFDVLDVPNESRGEFTSLGTEDLTRDRLRRMSVKLDELKNEKQKRLESASRMKEKIFALAAELSLTLDDEISRVLNINSVSSSSMHSIENCLKRLQKLRADRVDKISQIAVEITHLWDALQVPQNERDCFLARHSTLGQDVIESCEREIKRLTSIRDSQEQELFLSQRQELTDLWDSLHVPQEMRILPSGGDVFCQIEQEIVRLKQFCVENHDLIETINKRERIIADYEESKLASTDPQRLTSRSHEGVRKLMTEEKARKVYKTQLPKVDKKLIKMLRTYKKKKGEDFFWGGKPYLSKLSASVLKNEGIDNLAMHANIIPTPKNDTQKFKTLPRKFARPSAASSRSQLGTHYFSFAPK